MRTFVALCLTILLSAVHAADNNQFADVSIKAIPVGGSVSMLMGAGGNVAVSIGKDGTLLVDDQFPAMAQRIQNAITELGGAAPKLILNTHFHGDHVGGNAFFAERGVIVASRAGALSPAERSRAGARRAAGRDLRRPVRIQFNDDEIDVIHFPNAHTDGDAVVWFRNANVLHTGDLFFNGKYPRIDLDNGGSVAGYLAAVARLLEMVPADTRIIPGHGELASVVELGEFQDMLKATVSNIEARISAGESVDAIVATGLGPQWASYGDGLHQRRALDTHGPGEQNAVDRTRRRPAPLTMFDPLTLLADDRKRARVAGDPWANLCVLATIDAQQIPQARVVVLRDLEQRFAVFINGTSPKYAQLGLSRRHAVLVYLASLGVQYRLTVSFEPVPAALVRKSWLDRPRIPKVMDWLYEQFQPQSSAVPSRDDLVERYADDRCAAGPKRRGACGRARLVPGGRTRRSPGARGRSNPRAHVLSARRRDLAQRAN